MLNTYYFPCAANEISIDSDFMDELDKSAEWEASCKKNGWRMLIQKIAGEVILWTRHKTLIKQAVPELREVFRALPDDTMIDGELLSTFRIKNEPDSAYLFDIIMLKGDLLVKQPLWERRIALEAVLEESQIIDHPKIELAKQVRVGKKNLYWQALEEWPVNEGIVLKKIDSPYPISPVKNLTNPYWLKIKRIADHLKTGGVNGN